VSARTLREVAAAKLVLPPHEILEPQCVKLVEALNMLPGITTAASCGCCDHDTYYVVMAAESITHLLPLALLVRKPSCREWVIELTVETDGNGWPAQPPQVRFEIRTRTLLDKSESYVIAEKLAAKIRREARRLYAAQQNVRNDDTT